MSDPQTTGAKSAKSTESTATQAQEGLTAHNALNAQPALSYVETARRQKQGRELLEPYWPVIVAAHRDELPAQTIVMGGQEMLLSDYICRISANIRYGRELENPRLPDWLENLRRIQEAYTKFCAQQRENEHSAAVPVPNDEKDVSAAE